MNRTPRHGRAQRRILGIVLGVGGAGFVMAGAVGAVILAADGATEPTRLLIAGGVYLLAALLALAAIGTAYWLAVQPDADAPPAEGDAAEQSEASFDAQRRLLDDVRHELKTPITIVRGHLETMNPADPADVVAVRDIGIAELDRMTRLVNDIDLLAAVDGDSYSFSFIDLAALTQRVGELVSVIPNHSWTIEHRGTGRIRADHDRLLQAWLQLADNAAKYTPDGTPVEIGSAMHSSGAQLWVRDHGPGIPPASRHRIFRRFDRAAGRRSVGGSGLGLAIVDTIARAHGGHCTVADTPGGGATFTIAVPLGTGAAPPAPVRAGDVVLQREASA
ncbi:MULTISPECIES: HAMP domain-containing sensor histidine kinase [unclassified Microbacterium]|uniref:sensor histidine kinase n=1 Tax=unclassified Microbacterium TaxID=2609290 RepID=UPI00214B3022|nr:MULTISPECIES: HAMP domain-containing sensor histidine kinase [unclassified Microbacterium]MCR2784365.1 HAMP domain-containing histidine kinase [Microbacterium sp. zg.B96]MDL5350727.1 HAMP domain-containing sensor histidine kinase [Microbacterium sp. zg-YB36]WIM14815.1 HAMP domain-containing sensor histidine kinase [Microbacterium sp. zg-B96]